MTDSASMNPSPKVEEWQRALAAGERIELRRSRAKSFLLALLMLALAAITLLIALLSTDGSFMAGLIAALFLVCAVVFAYRGISAAPVAIISPEGVSTTASSDPIPWMEIRGTAIVPVERSRFVTLLLTPQEHARREELGDVTGELTSPEGETMHAAFLPNGLQHENDVIALIEIERQRRG